MNQETEQIEMIRQYLLGRLSEDELTAIDERVVTDQAFYEELLIVEDELIDEYLAEDLSADERKSFESHFLLTTERQDKLRFSLAFTDYLGVPPGLSVSEPEPQPVLDVAVDIIDPPPKWYERYLRIQSPVVAYSLMAATLLIVAGVIWVAIRNRSPQLSGPVYAVAINAGTTRGANDSENKFRVSPGFGTVELKAALRKDEYTSYQAVLLSDDTSELWRQTNLQARSDSGTRVVVVPVSARLLSPGYYSLKLTGLTADGKTEDLPTYRFHVIP